MGVIEQVCNSLLDVLKSSRQGEWERLRSIGGSQELAKETGI